MSRNDACDVKPTLSYYTKYIESLLFLLLHDAMHSQAQKEKQ